MIPVNIVPKNTLQTNNRNSKLLGSLTSSMELKYPSLNTNAIVTARITCNTAMCSREKGIDICRNNPIILSFSVHILPMAPYDPNMNIHLPNPVKEIKIILLIIGAVGKSSPSGIRASAISNNSVPLTRLYSPVFSKISSIDALGTDMNAYPRKYRNMNEA